MEENKICCPEKYAIFKTKKDKEGNYSYTALKCKVEEINKRYLETGEVLFTYRVSNGSKRKIVSEVFDTFEDASIMANFKNEEEKQNKIKAFKLEEKYPVKYATLQLSEPINYGSKRPVAYIASKCYVIEEKTLYFNNEEYKVYNVLFPYNDIVSFKENFKDKKIYLGERIYPKYSSNGKIYNITKVPYIYDTFEEAQSSARIMNSNSLKNLMDLLLRLNGVDALIDNRFNRIVQEKNRDFEICYLYEEMIRREIDNNNVYLENDSVNSFKNDDNKLKLLKK